MSEESFWPHRTTRISRRTHDAILFALEAIRKGKGKDEKPLSADTIEERARMSDLLRGTQPIGSGRAQNGGSRAGPVPVTGEPPRGVRTPTEIMRARNERDAKKKAEQEAAKLRELREEEARKMRQESETTEPDLPGQRRSRRFGEEQQATQEARRRSSVGQPSRRQDIPLGTGTSATSMARARASSGLDQGQPKPVAGQPPRISTGVRYDQQAAPPAAARRSRNTPSEPLGLAAEPTAKGNGQQTAGSGVQTTGSRQTARSGFPHAFERWETLSAHWEGLTSYWIHKLQQNSDELNTDPLNQQMTRQITDLSAAGANLFHAVVELQRLRASSERKFQRWFFETRSEQESAQEVQAELERVIRIEREEHAEAIATNQAERANAEDLVKEMRRELQISKEEARRAWEELGRREQEERERTVSLRSGEPTLVGGVQVVPMTQGVPSRQNTTTTRPSTQDGSYPGGSSNFGAQQASRQTTTSTLESPEDEQRQFTFEPTASSPTETDPFVENVQAEPAHPLHHEPGIPFFPSPQRPTQPPTSSAAMAATRSGQSAGPQLAALSPSLAHAQPVSTGGVGPRFYQQPGNEATILEPPPGPAARPGSQPSDNRSYIPSTVSGNGSSLGEEEYEIGSDGNYRRDAQGRRIPYQPPGGRLASDDGSDEYDVAADIERERRYRERYGGNTGYITTSAAGPSSRPTPAEPSTAYARQQQHTSAVPQQPASAYSQVTQLSPEQQSSPADYSGQGWGGGWEGLTPRHRQQTRLSDILEERSGRTSPSRASFISGGGESARGDIGGSVGRRGER